MTIPADTFPDLNNQGTLQYRQAIDLTSPGQFFPFANDPATMAVEISPGNIWASGATQTVAAEKIRQTTGLLTAPSSNPRIDIVTVTRANGTLAVTTGAEDASPVDPEIDTTAVIPICRIRLATSTTEITSALIDDLRTPWIL